MTAPTPCFRSRDSLSPVEFAEVSHSRTAVVVRYPHRFRGCVPTVCRVAPAESTGGTGRVPRGSETLRSAEQLPNPTSIPRLRSRRSSTAAGSSPSSMCRPSRWTPTRVPAIGDSPPIAGVGDDPRLVPYRRPHVERTDGQRLLPVTAAWRTCHLPRSSRAVTHVLTRGSSVRDRVAGPGHRLVPERRRPVPPVGPRRSGQRDHERRRGPDARCGTRRYARGAGPRLRLQSPCSADQRTVGCHGRRVLVLPGRLNVDEQVDCQPDRRRETRNANWKNRNPNCFNAVTLVNRLIDRKDTHPSRG